MARSNNKLMGRYDKQILINHIAGLAEKEISKTLGIPLRLVLDVLHTYSEMAPEDAEELHSILGLESRKTMRLSGKETVQLESCIDLTEFSGLSNGVGESDSEANSEKIVKKRKYSKDLNQKLSSKKHKSSVTTIEANLPLTEDFSLLQADHEAFVKSFAVNTHLYRYLSENFKANPIILYRSLRYMIPNSRTVKRPSLEEIIKLLRRNKNVEPGKSPRKCLKIFSSIPTNPSSGNSWPDEIEIIFESWQDSPKEYEWTTVDASVDLRARFGFCWRRKSCPVDCIILLTRGGIAELSDLLSNHVKHLKTLTIPCTSNINTNSNKDVKVSTNSIKLNLQDLLHRARLCDTDNPLSVKRIRSAHLEIHVTADECRRPKSSTNNGLTMNGNHKRASINNSALYPVHYVTAPLPIFVECLDYPGDVAMGPAPLCLTPGRYELRLGLDREDQIHDQDLQAICFGTPITIATRSKNSVGVNGGGSGRLQWNKMQSMRFPASSNVLEDYDRWPSIRFRVQWHSNTSKSQQVNDILDKKSPPVNVCKDRRRNCSNSSSSSELSSQRSPERRTRSQTASNDEEVLSLPSDSKSLSSNNLISLRTSSHTRSSFKRRSSTLANSLTNEKNPVIVIKSFLTNSDDRKVAYSLTNIPSLSEKVPCSVTYRFLYAGRLQQWTEAQDLICPWCHFNSWRAKTRGPEALISHLRAFHCRFRFEAKWNPSKLHLSIEVSLNDTFDCSNDCGLRRWAVVDAARYCKRVTVLDGSVIGGWDGLGSPSTQMYQGSGGPSSTSTSGSATPISGTNKVVLTAQTNGQSVNLPLPNSNEVYGFTGVLGDSVNSSVYALSRGFCRVRKPIRRPTFTELIFWHGLAKNLAWITDPTLSLRPRAVGHNRVYYHTWSCQPIRTCEFDIDSESEEDALEWLREHYQRKVEEFTDVNIGEKKMMQIWNSYLLSITPNRFVVSDSLMATVIVPGFLEKYGAQIMANGLRFNLLLHLTNLVEYGLLSSKRLRNCMEQVDRLANTIQSA